MITRNKKRYLPNEFRNNEEVISQIPVILSCAGLLHDIGNPPFGHFGEVVIGEWFKKEFERDEFVYKDKPIRDILSAQMKKDLENFEGNAQALRILSKAKHHEDGYDVNLSYAVLNTLVKYPTNSLNFKPEDEDVKRHKLGYFYAEREIMDTICKSTGTENNTDYIRHPLVFLIEAADDIAYSTADLEDAFKKGLFTLDQFTEYFEKQINSINSSDLTYTKRLNNDLKNRIVGKDRNAESDLISFQKWMELVRKWLMYVVAFSFSKNYKEILCGTYKYDMFYDTYHKHTIKILKGAMREFAFNNKEIIKLELAAKKIIESLLKDFVYAVIYWDVESAGDKYKPSKADKKFINIISTNYRDDYLRARTKNDNENLYLRFMMVTDYISGMTDTFAKNLYQELNGIY